MGTGTPHLCPSANSPIKRYRSSPRVLDSDCYAQNRTSPGRIRSRCADLPYSWATHPPKWCGCWGQISSFHEYWALMGQSWLSSCRECGFDRVQSWLLGCTLCLSPPPWRLIPLHHRADYLKRPRIVMPFANRPRLPGWTHELTRSVLTLVRSNGLRWDFFFLRRVTWRDSGLISSSPHLFISTRTCRLVLQTGVLDPGPWRSRPGGVLDLKGPPLSILAQAYYEGLSSTSSNARFLVIFVASLQVAPFSSRSCHLVDRSGLFYSSWRPQFV